MKQLLTPLLAVAALSAAPLHANSAIRYEFQAFSAYEPNVVGSFWFETSDFIRSDLLVQAADLGACSVVQPTGDSCRAVLFKVDTTEYHGGGAGDTDDAVNFQVGATGPVYYFQNGAFGAVGLYDSTLLGPSQQARLTVSQVPEGSTLAMALAGLVFLGVVGARRRPA